MGSKLEILESLKTRKGRRFLKILVSFFVFSFIFFLSLKMANKRYQEEIEDLKKKLQSSLNTEKVKKLREDYQKYKELLTLFENSKYESETIYEFFILLSRSVSSRIQINKIEIFPKDHKSIEFFIYGLAKDSSNVRAFARRMTKKRGKIISTCDILELSREEQSDLFKFKVSGRFTFSP